MKTLITLIALLFAVNAYGARWFSSPEVPNVTCANGIDDDADGTVDAADADCAAASPFAANGNGYRADAKDSIVTGYDTTTDAGSSSGTYLKKTSQSSPYWLGEFALHANFTNATYYGWIRYRCSETQCPVWFSTSAIKGSPNNATQAMILPQAANWTWAQILYTGSNANFRSGTNGGGARTFALNGNGAIFGKSASGLEIDCIDIDPDADHTPDCPAADQGGSTFDYEVYDVASAPTASADFDNANEITFTGYSDAIGYTVTRARILWDKDASPQRVYVYAEITDTDGQNGSATGNDSATWFTSSSVRGDSIDLRWRSPADLSATFDTDTYNSSCNVNDLYADRDWTGGSSTLATNLTTTSVGTVVASTSWSILCSFDAGGTITADTIGLAQFFITDRDAAAASSKFMFGTDSGAATDASQWGRFKWSSTAVPGSPPSTPTAGNVSFINVTSSSFVVSWDYDTGSTDNGTCKVKYDTTTGLQGTESETTTVASSGGTCSVPVTGLTAGTTYYVYGTSINAQAASDDSAENSQATAASDATLFVDASSSGDCLTIKTPCAFATAKALAVPGSIIEAAAGTYQGATRMIVPSGNGTQANPITIRCATDGACLIDGQNARIPIQLSNNDYFIIEGFNAKNSSGSVVYLASGADNNIVRRVCAWDAPDNTNNAIFLSTGNTGNLLEDVCGFGKGRKIFSNSQGGNNLTIRRAWGMWERSTQVGPKQVFNNVYNSYNAIYENVIGTWDETAMLGAAVNQPMGILSGDSLNSAPFCANARYYGSIAYIPTGATATTSLLGGLRASNDQDCQEFHHTVAFMASNKAIKPASLVNWATGTATTHILNRSTLIGSTSSSIGSDWTQTNNSSGANVAAVPNIWDGAGTSGARVCFRYENGTLTSEKLWPWPMNQRIIDAMTAAGKTPVDVTATMESIFGTIPAECKT